LPIYEGVDGVVSNRPLLPDVARSELCRSIVGGEVSLGSQLPNEEALCARFLVSRITLREAVRGLIEDGYLIPRQGAGTFVISGPALRIRVYRRGAGPTLS
jgi:DNA-binding GntR family transcriptional regulator